MSDSKLTAAHIRARDDLRRCVKGALNDLGPGSSQEYLAWLTARALSTGYSREVLAVDNRDEGRRWLEWVMQSAAKFIEGLSGDKLGLSLRWSDAEALPPIGQDVRDSIDARRQKLETDEDAADDTDEDAEEDA